MPPILLNKEFVNSSFDTIVTDHCDESIFWLELIQVILRTIVLGKTRKNYHKSSGISRIGLSFFSLTFGLPGSLLGSLSMNFFTYVGK